MKTMHKKALIYAMTAVFIAVMAFAATPAAASSQMYGNYGYQQTYPYQYQNNYGNYSNSYPYGTNTNYSSNYGGGVCPVDFVLTTYNGLYGCWKFPYNYGNYNYNGYNNNYNYGNNYYDDNYNNNYNNNYNYQNYNYNYSNGNADLSNFQVSDGRDSNIEEGDDNAEIMNIRFNVDDGDARLDRAQIDFDLTSSGSTSYRPWNVFDRIRLLVDGHEVDEINASNSGEWSHTSGDIYRLDFNNINESLIEGDRVNMTLEADVSNDIRTSNRSITFDLSVPDNGIRARDNDNRVIEIGNDNDTAEVEIVI